MQLPTVLRRLPEYFRDFQTFIYFCYVVLEDVEDVLEGHFKVISRSLNGCFRRSIRISGSPILPPILDAVSPNLAVQLTGQNWNG